MTNFGFHDFDRNPLTDWAGAKVGAEIVFESQVMAQSPLRWNSIYSFWFDSNAVPMPGSVLLDQFDIGPGALTVAVSSTTPSGIYNHSLGDGCGNPSAPSLAATGSPARALLGNATLALRSTGNQAGSICAFLLSTSPGSTLVAPGCTAYTADPLTMLGPVVMLADGSGVASLPLPVPLDPALEGSVLDFQMLNVSSGGQLFSAFNLSNGVRIRVGNMISGCP